MLKRALFAFTTLLFLALPLLFVAPKIAHAQEDPVNKLLEEFNNRRRGDQMNLETWYSGKLVDDPADPASIGFSSIILLDAYSRMMGKTDFTNPTKLIELLLSDTKTDIFAPLKKPAPTDTALGKLGGVLSLAYSSPPVSFANYVASVKDNIQKKSVVQPAYAQGGAGFGFNNLLPVLPIWRAFRNVAYFVFILVFVLYGFMIMFRMKINPQNVATFQTAIPKIVTTLLLITFAYAIAGFLMDLMLLIFNLILSVFESSGLINTTNPVGKVMVQVGSGQAGILVSWLFSTIISILFVPSSLINVLTNLPGWLSVVLDILLTATGIGLIVRIIIIIAVGYSYVKLMFKLFEAYITIIIQVIFSPLILLQDVLPGSQAFGNWVRNIAAHLSVFPVSMVMFLLSYIFMIQPLLVLTGGGGLSGIQSLDISAGGFNMPLISGLGTGLGGAESEAILAVVGFFIILMASKYVDMVRDALKVPPFKYGTALGEALQYGYGAQRGGVGTEIAARMPGAYGRLYRWSRGGLEAAGGAMGAFEAPKPVQKVEVVPPAPPKKPPTTP